MSGFMQSTEQMLNNWEVREQESGVSSIHLCLRKFLSGSEPPQDPVCPHPNRAGQALSLPPQ